MKRFEGLDRIERRVGIFALNVQVVLRVDQSLSNDFHQQGSVGETEEYFLSKFVWKCKIRC